ncbi:patatin-like phospholipase family protein [Halomicrobium sp. LC1Hm]|uniref:patatin-like phospholipase family protein n=1 Tax=Halomicrobium sp. LC1Hm TaxID=2610902 RepID=UPI0012984C20|nr:patatin-like phospholipase family protein [Halomicrobium sp. LC1Hm]QGA84089.1 Alpha-beta superfamily hydrolase, patatin/cPLA2 family [Halomicrobium sp. LC1Hm]
MSENVPADDVSTDDDPTRVAIACQGGGSHTAFTCGVLRTILEEWDDENYDLVGVSGTSGGAFNALAMWYGLLTGDAEKASGILGGIWDDMAVDGPQDRWLNSWATGISRMESAGFAIPSVSPSQIPMPELGKQRIRTILERYIDFEEIPALCRREAPELVVGTVNVNEGIFETFRNEEVTVEAVLASAAVPNLFEAVKIHGHYHWDGLFSQNPPVGDLMHQPPGQKPEELWVIQVNPQRFEGEPTTSEVIADRRNELSGNISLNQELGFIERVNDWVETGKLPADEFQHTEIRRIEMGKRFHCSTKVDRDPAFLDELRDLGEQRAHEFLDG